MIRGIRASNSMCGRIVHGRDTSYDVKAKTMDSEIDSDLNSLSPTKESQNKENFHVLFPTKMQRKTVKILDISDSSKAKLALTAS